MRRWNPVFASLMILWLINPAAAQPATDESAGVAQRVESCIIAGSLANSTNNENLSVQVGVDRESSRLAVTIGDTDDVVIEAGLNTIIEEQSGIMVHYQNNTRENWLLVKMPESEVAGKKQASTVTPRQ